MMRFLALGVALGLGACIGPNHVVASLIYAPVVTVAPATAPSVGAVEATDRRTERPTRLATIFDAFGQPLKTLETPQAVKDEVADAFAIGLRARGLLVPDGAASRAAPFRLALLVRRFDADLLMGRTARLTVTMSVIDRAGATVYADSAVDSASEGYKPFGSGLFAEIDELKQLCEIVLARTVDTMLDKPGFRAALTGRAF